MIFTLVLVGVTVALFGTAAMWSGPGGSLERWMTNG